MRALYLLLVLAACGGDEAVVSERLLSRRAALGLGREPLHFPDAMAELEAGRYEAILTRVGSRRLPRDQVLDAALKIENVLARTDVAGAGKHRAADSQGFDAFFAAAREAAAALARATAGGEDGQAEARALLTSCLDCHATFRPRR